VQCPGDQLLARAGLSHDEHSDSGGSHPFDELQQLPDGRIVADDAVSGRRQGIAGHRLEDELCLAHPEHRVHRHHAIDEAEALRCAGTVGGDEEGAVGGVQILYTEAVLTACHLKVAAGDEAVLNHHLVLSALADGEAIGEQLAARFVGAMPQTDLEGHATARLGGAGLNLGAGAGAGGAFKPVPSVLAVDRAPPSQLQVNPIQQLAVRHRLASDHGAVAGQVLQHAASAIEVERHVLTAHLWIWNDDVAETAAAEHEAPLLQSHPEDFDAPSQEHQFWHDFPLSTEGGYSGLALALPTGWDW
jgi:hypothetical protein